LSSLAVSNGATVYCPDGLVIEAGSVFRKRSALILARRELTGVFGVAPLTRPEVDLVLEFSGHFAYEMTGINRPNRFIQKLKTLGLLGSDERILSGQGLALAVRRIDEAMAMAQASIASVLWVPKEQEKAIAAAMESKRNDLATNFPALSLQANSRTAKIRWTKAFISMLQQVVASGSEGLSLAGIEGEDGEVLLSLHRHRLVSLEVTDGRKAFLVTEFGQRRLAEVQAEVEAASRARYDGLYQLPSSSLHFPGPEKRKLNHLQPHHGPKPIEKDIKHEIRTPNHRR